MNPGESHPLSAVGQARGPSRVFNVFQPCNCPRNSPGIPEENSESEASRISGRDYPAAFAHPSCFAVRPPCGPETDCSQSPNQA